MTLVDAIFIQVAMQTKTLRDNDRVRRRCEESPPARITPCGRTQEVTS